MTCLRLEYGIEGIGSRVVIVEELGREKRREKVESSVSEILILQCWSLREQR